MTPRCTKTAFLFKEITGNYSRWKPRPFTLGSVCHVLSPLCARKLRLYQPIHTGIDGHQIKTITASSSNSPVKLISYEMIRAPAAAHAAAAAASVFYLDSMQGRRYSSPGECPRSPSPPIKSRVMKLLCALSPQHCSIKDDTIIFYQLTKNADKLWFNKMQSALRGAPGPPRWGHSSWGCFGSESTFPHNKARKKKKSGCDDIRNKEWSISCVLERLCHVIWVQHIFPRRSLNRQNWTPAPPPPGRKCINSHDICLWAERG